MTVPQNKNMKPYDYLIVGFRLVQIYSLIGKNELS